MTYVDEIQHPKTGEFHLLEAADRDGLQQKIAEVLADAEDLTVTGERA